MRIVHTEASLGWGGQEIRILEESRGMIQRGHAVTLLCSPESCIYEEAPRRGVPVVALPIGKKRLKGAMAMRKWLAANPVDVINSHSSTDSWLAALACKTLRQAPALVRTRHISAPITQNARTDWLYTKATRHIVTTGEAIRQMLVRDNGYPAERITSVPTGIDPARFTPGDRLLACKTLGLDPSLFYIGIVATLRSWKGQLFLLEAFARLNVPACHLLIVGEGPMRPNLEAKIAELGLGGHVSLVGQQDRPELWMQAMDIFCLPSYANEGVPQAILQAMFSGLPIVTTPVGAITEAVMHGETGLVVPPRDAAALHLALQSLMSAPALRTQLGMKARKVAEMRFSFNSMLDKMEVIFRAAITDNR